MNVEIKQDNNCIIKAFENNPISILEELNDNKKVYYFKAIDIGKALNLTNIRVSIQNYDEDEQVVRKAYDLRGCEQNTIFLTSQGVYRLLYNSKKEVAKKFRKWAGNILDDIIFNNSKELTLQLKEQERLQLLQQATIENLTVQKELEKHNLLLREFQEYCSIVYIILVKHNEDNTYIVKIGESRYGISDRFDEHKSNYPECIILDIFRINRSHEFEKSIHHKFNQYKTTLPGHETEKELFLIGGNMTYKMLLDYIHENKKHYQDVSQDVQRYELENQQLRLLNNITISQDFINTLVNGQKELLNKISQLENQVLNLSNKLITRSGNDGFNQPLVTIGNRLQKINPENFTLIQVYETVNDLLRQEIHIKRPSLTKAIKENTIYNNYRWNFVKRDQDPTIVNIQPTKEIRVQNIGYIAKLNRDKSAIEAIYLDRKTAAILNNCISDSSLDNVVRSCKLYDEHYYVLYQNCSLELRENYNVPILYKDGIGQFQDGVLVQEFTCKNICCRTLGISDRTLNKALTSGLPYNNYIYKNLGDKLYI
jgi:prophage antirepressor-like protein